MQSKWEASFASQRLGAVDSREGEEAERNEKRTLGQGLDLGRLDLHTAEADNAFDDNGGQHGSDSHGRELDRLSLTAGKQFLNRLLQDLDEGDDHDDAEDEDTKGLEATAADGEALVKCIQAPLDQAVGGPDYEGAEKVEGAVDKRGDEGEGRGEEGGGDLGATRKGVSEG